MIMAQNLNSLEHKTKASPWRRGALLENNTSHPAFSLTSFRGETTWDPSRPCMRDVMGLQAAEQLS
jgi:hypothetical protein